MAKAEHFLPRLSGLRTQDAEKYENEEALQGVKNDKQDLGWQSEVVDEEWDQDTSTYSGHPIDASHEHQQHEKHGNTQLHMVDCGVTPTKSPKIQILECHFLC